MLKKFRLQIILRVLLLMLSLAAFLSVAFLLNLLATSILLGSLVLLQLILLIRYVEQTNSLLKRFFDGIRYDDFVSRKSVKGKGKVFEELGDSMEAVTEQFRQIRAEKEAGFRHLEQVMHHVAIALISVEEDGTVRMMNQAAKRLLGIARLRHLDDLANSHESLYASIEHLKPNDKTLIQYPLEHELLHLVIQMTEFELKSHSYRLISLQNIRPELEKNEIEAWQKLIRVLTHEIMNSITPVSTLADTLDAMLFGKNEQFRAKEMDEEDAEDVKQALHIIRNRTKGLMTFVDSYRNLTKIPPPRFQMMKVRELLSNVARLLKRKFEQEKVEVEWKCQPDNLELIADEQLVEQVLLNLILNAIHAMEEAADKKLYIGAFRNALGRVELIVQDNGCGISAEDQEKVFIPFYSSKEEGSGIGLSISRQIMQAHGGNLSLRSELGQGSEFIMQF